MGTSQMDLFNIDEKGNLIPKQSEVRVRNTINTIGLSGMTASDMDMFYLLLSKMKGKGSSLQVFSFDELIQELLRNNPKARYRSYRVKKTINQLADKLNNIKVEMISQKEDTTKVKHGKFTIFPTYLIDEERETLSIAINKQFADLINDFSNGNYTEFFLPEMLERETAYTKKLLPILKQWKSVGYVKISIDNLRKVLSIPDSYSTGDIWRRVLDPAVEELKEVFDNLDYQKNKRVGMGNKIYSITFTFDPQKSILEQKEDVSNKINAEIYPLEKVGTVIPRSRPQFVKLIKSYLVHIRNFKRDGKVDEAKLLRTQLEMIHKMYDSTYSKKSEK